MDTRGMTVSAHTSLDKFAHDLAKQKDVSWVLVEDSSYIAGIVASDTIFVTTAQCDGTITLGDIARKDYFVTVQEEMPLLEVINRMRDSGADIALDTSKEETGSTGKDEGGKNKTGD
jgi:predicted transcriptional regulator